LERLSHQRCLERMLELMDYAGLRREQAALRAKGVHRGIGLASFVEITNPGPAFYGVGGAPISAQDGCTLRLDPGGSVTLAISVTEQGQGTETAVAQIAASVLGVSLERVRVVTGDTERTPYGGGTWASRGTGIGGEAALQAAKALRANVLALAGAILQAAPAALDIRADWIVDGESGAQRIRLDEVGRAGYFRGDTLPPDVQPELVATRHYQPREYPFAFTNGVQASWLEVDVETGFVTLLKHWVVEDCGTVVNPLLVDEQIRGGVVQGLGATLFEECAYDAQGQLLNGTLADYLVPMAGEMPDIVVAHLVTPTTTSELGAKGVGEAGTAGAPAAVMNAINDALLPFGARIEAHVTPHLRHPTFVTNRERATAIGIAVCLRKLDAGLGAGCRSPCCREQSAGRRAGMAPLARRRSPLIIATEEKACRESISGRDCWRASQCLPSGVGGAEAAGRRHADLYGEQRQRGDAGRPDPRPVTPDASTTGEGPVHAGPSLHLRHSSRVAICPRRRTDRSPSSACVPAPPRGSHRRRFWARRHPWCRRAGYKRRATACRCRHGSWRAAAAREWRRRRAHRRATSLRRPWPSRRRASRSGRRNACRPASRRDRTASPRAL